MRAARSVVVVAVLLLVAVASAEAREGYILRFAGASIYPTGELRIDERDAFPLGDGTILEEEFRAAVEADSAFGFCIDVERRFSDRFGLGLTLMRAEHDVDAFGSETVRIRDDATGSVLFEHSESLAAPLGSVDVTPILLGANFHLTPGRRVDLYAGPFVGLIDFGDLRAEGERIGFKDELAYGATLGLDVPFGQSSAGFAASARYMIAGAETDEVGSETLDLDPLVVLVGVGYRF